MSHEATFAGPYPPLLARQDQRRDIAMIGAPFHILPQEYALNPNPPPAFDLMPSAALVAGPPAASPPLLIALMIVALSIAGPFIFLKDGTPSLLLGITALAVAVAGMITAVAAARAQIRRRADAIRTRVQISRTGIILHPSREPAGDLSFGWEHITNVHLGRSTFFVHAGPNAPSPGRHAIRFGKLVTPRADIISALAAIQPKSGNLHE